MCTRITYTRHGALSLTYISVCVWVQTGISCAALWRHVQVSLQIIQHHRLGIWGFHQHDYDRFEAREGILLVLDQTKTTTHPDSSKRAA